MLPHRKLFFKLENLGIFMALFLIMTYHTGPHVSYVGTTRLPFSQLPLLLHNGCLTLQSANGKSNFLYLQTHSFLGDTKDEDAVSILILCL